METATLQWEYKTFVARGGMALTDQRLNELGRERWELIAFELNAAGHLLYIFKRDRVVTGSPDASEAARDLGAAQDASVTLRDQLIGGAAVAG
jgi:hypothetical protein